MRNATKKWLVGLIGALLSFAAATAVVSRTSSAAKPDGHWHEWWFQLQWATARSE